MSAGNLILGANSVTGSYLIRYESYYKMWQILLPSATAILLQNATEVYSKICQDFYYQMRQLLQNATFTRYWDSAFNEYGRFIQVTK